MIVLRFASTVLCLYYVAECFGQPLGVSDGFRIALGTGSLDSEVNGFRISHQFRAFKHFLQFRGLGVKMNWEGLGLI